MSYPWEKRRLGDTNPLHIPGAKSRHPPRRASVERQGRHHLTCPHVPQMANTLETSREPPAFGPRRRSGGV